MAISPQCPDDIIYLATAPVAIRRLHRIMQIRHGPRIAIT
jgi:hypothetical protein